jgi:hypothetical protein
VCSSALHAYMASSLQFRASKINMALARMDKLVKKLMSNPEITREVICNNIKTMNSNVNEHLKVSVKRNKMKP